MILPGFLDLIDILVVAAFGFFVIGALRRTRARSALLGLALLTIVYFVASGLSLRLTTSLLQGFFAVVVIVLVVVFQEDLRRFFDGLGAWRPGQPAIQLASENTDVLARAIVRLAADRTGALIVLPGREPLDRHLQGGVRLDAVLSEPLLLSLFDASSPGHDGAILVRNGRVERFAVHLPLSSNHEALGSGGTRHAAALGLSERCDSVAIAVSEERGTVSVARQGALEVLSRAEDVVSIISETTSPPEPGERARQRSLRDALLSTATAIALWMVFVPGADVAEKTLSLPVGLANLPEDSRLEAVVPPEISVTLRGSRRELFLTNESDVAVQIDGYLAQLGRRTFEVEESSVRKPASVSIVSIEPKQVKISLSLATPGASVHPPGSGR